VGSQRGLSGGGGQAGRLAVLYARGGCCRRCHRRPADSDRRTRSRRQGFGGHHLHRPAVDGALWRA
jgi:hypothetical protein